MIDEFPQTCPASHLPHTLRDLVDEPRSELREIVERFALDRDALLRRWDAPGSPARRDRLREFYGAWLRRLEPLQFEQLGREGRLDALLLRNHLRASLRALDLEAQRWADLAERLPFAPQIFDLHEARRQGSSLDPARTAAGLADLAACLSALTEQEPVAPRANGSADAVCTAAAGLSGMALSAGRA
jgi:hypothetical protein